MILFRRFLMTNITLQKLGYRTFTAGRKPLFYTCLTPSTKFSGKTCVLYPVRYRGTNVVETKVLKSSVRPAARTKKNLELRNLFMLAAPEKWRIVGAITFLAVSSAITMSVPFYVGKLIDIIYTGDKENVKENLTWWCIVLSGVFVVGGLCNFCRVYLMSTTGHRITQSLRKKLYTAILHQEVAFFDKCKTGELVGRLSADTQLISSSLTNNISDGLRSFIMIVSGMSMMFYTSTELAVFGLAVVPPTAGLAVICGRHLKNISKNMQSSLASLNATAEERIGNIRTVKMFAKEMPEVNKFHSQLENMLKLCYKESLHRAIFFGLTGLVGNIIVVSVLYRGGMMVADSSITIGNLNSFLMYAAYVGISLNGLSSFYSELNKALGANAHVAELIDRQSTIPVRGGNILEAELSGDIEFQNVSFAYPTRRSTWVLKNFSLKIPKSAVIAIVGSSGSGKSTVASLLLRLYDPDTGSVLLDNHDLRSLDPAWVKSQVSVVSQEPVLFSGTIRDNISYGEKDATKCDVEDAAKRAHVLDFTKNLPDGLDTVVGERGVTLSGGQRQRVAIARALIKEPKILILDEATSALDAESEHFVQQALEKAVRGRTVLTIAHRLSTIKNADKIIVLHQGQVAESGTYKELLNLKDGYFNKLIQHQMFS